MKFNRLLIIAIASFFCCIFVFILDAKYVLFRGIKPHSWQEILENLHLFILISFFVAIVFTFSIYADKYGKKEKK